ncbi:cytochrome c oxidase subunit II [Phycisphaerales bacterium AB-hyl4]|uniref:Cytochrome c oxidase subunit 2 n=1 Tax=Natronomicrosphaera hydrolytica TaxID=3242702 RepID=A0ABV4U418_9BACT
MMLAILAQSQDPSFYLPAQDSTFAAEYDWTWYFIYYISAFFTVGISLAAIYFAVKYRRTDKRLEGEHTHTHHTALEMTWTIIPLILVLAIFWFGFQGFMDKATPPRDTYDITVNSNRWSWTFIYPNGAITNTLYVPADRPVKLTLTSEDVIHSVFIPAFRVKMDAVPGRYNQMWFQANYDPGDRRVQPVLDELEGEFNGIVHPLYCAEYCGRRHSVMEADVVVLPMDQFRSAIAQLAEPTGTPAEIGQRLTQIHGCVQCHAFDEDATVATGPALYDFYGMPDGRPQTDGSTPAADAEYIRESILYPGRRITQGYRNEMPSFAGRLSDNEILAITEYLKSISTHYDGELMEYLPGQEPDEEANDEPAVDEPVEEANGDVEDDADDQDADVEADDEDSNEVEADSEEEMVETAA